jgi:hypothetical protein
VEAAKKSKKGRVSVSERGSSQDSWLAESSSSSYPSAAVAIPMVSASLRRTKKTNTDNDH